AALGFAVLAGRRPEKLVEPSRLRVAISLRAPVPGVRPDEPNRKAVNTAARLLVAAGHDVIAADPAYPPTLSGRGLATWFAAVARDARHAGLDRRALQPRTRRHIALGEWAERRGLVRDEDRERWRQRAMDFFADRGVDLLLTPALATVPPPAIHWARRSWLANVMSNIRYAPYAAPWNLAGLPAIVVPVGQRPDGLPVAVQVVGMP